MTQVRRYDNYTMSERQGNENTRYTNDEYLDRINNAFLEASRLTQEAEDLTVFEYEDQGAKLHRLFDTYWKLSDSIDRLREEVWDADDSFHRDVNQTANELEIIRLEEIRVPDTIGYYPSGGGNPRQLGIKDFMEVGVRETDADIEGFREIFGRTVICGEDEMTLETYIRTLETDSEFDIEYYCPEKEWINELLSIGSFGIKNLYDGMAGYDIITGEHLSKREKESRFIWGIIETALSIFLAVAAATGLLGKISSKLSQKISPLMEKLEPYIKPYITKIDDAVGHVQKQIRQAVQRAGGVVDDTFRLEPIAGETIETLGKDVIQESGEAAGREILQEGSETVETIQSSLDVKEEVQTVVADEVKIGGEGGTSSKIGYEYLDDQLGNLKDKVKINQYQSAESVNAWWEARGYKSPYKEKTVVQNITLTEDTKFVRVYDGVNSNLEGGWVMRAEDIKGLTPKEIQAKFALEYEPKFIGEVELKAGDTVRLGEVGPNFGFDGGGIQIDLQQQWIGDFTELGKIEDWR